MDIEVILNTTSIWTDAYEERFVYKNGQPLQEISFTFLVRSGEEYRQIATLLYEGTFAVSVPSRGVSFRGAITQYMTDSVNLYEGNKVSTYSVTLTEVL